MRLTSIALSGFKSFAKKTELSFDTAITAIVGPNGSGKSNIAEAFRFALGEQSMKSMRGRRGEDLIWNGSASAPRAGRASVKLVLDNADRAFSLDFDNVSIERAVARDGANEYRLNNSTVRLRDITALLASVGIGASGHHIISQGEADRILSASSRERREMIEDALGLTAYLYRREEAERKLQKAAENVREVEALRRELAPHLRFLQGQVKKIEESEKLREALAAAYLEYLKREHVYTSISLAQLKEERAAPLRERDELDKKIAHLRGELEKKGDGDATSHELVRLEAQGSAARQKRETLTRELGRIEGELAARERLAHQRAARGGTLAVAEAAAFAEELAAALEEAQSRDFAALRAVASSLARRAREFAARITRGSMPGGEAEDGGEDAAVRREKLEHELHVIRAAEERVLADVARLRQKMEHEKDASRDAERDLFTAMARRNELEVRMGVLAARQESLTREESALKEEVREAAALIGRAALDYADYAVRDAEGAALSDQDIMDEERGAQETRRRKVERMKIKLEEAGAGDASEVLREHQETRERDDFLARELADLAASSESLRALIAELTQTLQTRFTEGISTISEQFNEFFKLMFGGGEAKLALVKERRVRRGAGGEEIEEDEETGAEQARVGEKEEYEEGIDINISMPHKRVKGLHMLSGGERALTSIALIFAMSQVNPPPFLILDETDAALDEANSRRYGDMIETLAKKSQLILITHNRETMSRAGILYGVTMGSDGASKLLSVRFDEAVAVAK